MQEFLADSGGAIGLLILVGVVVLTAIAVRRDIKELDASDPLSKVPKPTHEAHRVVVPRRPGSCKQCDVGTMYPGKTKAPLPILGFLFQLGGLAAACFVLVPMILMLVANASAGSDSVAAATVLAGAWGAANILVLLIAAVLWLVGSACSRRKNVMRCDKCGYGYERM